jgi:hypothetical protein
VASFARNLPGASIYVYDNNSTDGTDKLARQAGAIVRPVGLQGKGHVVRRAFADIEADVYVLVDGDGTYDASGAPQMVAMVVSEGSDLVNAGRQPTSGYSRRGHEFGNRLLTPSGRAAVPAARGGHVVGLQGLLAAVRQVLPVLSPAASK